MVKQDVILCIVQASGGQVGSGPALGGDGELCEAGEFAGSFIRIKLG